MAMMTENTDMWVLANQDGVYTVIRATSEEDVWHVCLGFPSIEEVEQHKRNGYYVAPATVSWNAPDAEA